MSIRMDASINSMVKFFDLLALRVHPTFCRIGPMKRKRQILRVLQREGLAKHVQRNGLHFKWTATARLRRVLNDVSKDRSKWAASPQSKRERELVSVFHYWRPSWLDVVGNAAPNHPFSLENNWHMFKILIRVIFEYQCGYCLKWLCSDLLFHRNTSKLPAEAVVLARETLMVTVLDICVADMRTTMGQALFDEEEGDEEDEQDEEGEDGEDDGGRLPQLPGNSTVRPSESMNSHTGQDDFSAKHQSNSFAPS